MNDPEASSSNSSYPVDKKNTYGEILIKQKKWRRREKSVTIWNVETGCRIRSKEEVSAKFEHDWMKVRHYAKKVASALIRPAIDGEVVQTMIDGKAETLPRNYWDGHRQKKVNLP